MFFLIKYDYISERMAGLIYVKIAYLYDKDRKISASKSMLLELLN